MEINENQLNEKSKSYLFGDVYSKGVRHHYLSFDRASKAKRGVGKLYSGKKIEDYRNDLIGGCWHGDAAEW